ncbi:MAG: DUF6359 domain-containing protein [Mangrovibacterium sp.]
MKRLFLFLLLALVFQACKFSTNAIVLNGYLELKTSVNALQELSGALSEKEVETSNFLVYIYQSSGKLLSGYPKVYSDMNDQVELLIGDYQIKVYSVSPDDFPFPTFDETWIYFGSQDFSITSDQVTKVDITAALLTSKVVFDLSDDFLLAYPDYVFSIGDKTVSASTMKPIYVEGGKKLTVVKSYTEDGNVVSHLYESTKEIEAGTLVTVRFNYEGGTLDTGDSSFNIIVDSTLGEQLIDWNVDDGVLVEDNPVADKGSLFNPYTVEEAQAKQDNSEAWVEGYIVGHVKGSNTVIINHLEASDSNIAIASTKGETNISNMLFVELPDSSAGIRNILGLCATSGTSIGYRVKLKGVLETYYSRAGLKGVNAADEYEIISQ